MSLVQAVLCSEFALVCGEQQLNLTSGGVLHNFRKIFKVNESVIIGLSGAIEVFHKVTARYREMTEQGECDVFSLVCGWNGYGFEGKTFFLSSQFQEENRIADVRPLHEKDAKVISCGDDRHYHNFVEAIYRYGADVYGVQRSFRDVLARGVMFDGSIDKNAQFELIRRPG